MEQCREFIDLIPNICLRESTILFLETRGAPYLTLLMYQNHKKNSQNKGTNSVEQPSSQEANKFFIILLFVIYFFEKLCLVFYYLLWFICIVLAFLFFRTS
jgi:hypothetical protein